MRCRGLIGGATSAVRRTRPYKRPWSFAFHPASSIRSTRGCRRTGAQLTSRFFANIWLAYNENFYARFADWKGTLTSPASGIIGPVAIAAAAAAAAGDGDGGDDMQRCIWTEKGTGSTDVSLCDPLMENTIELPMSFCKESSKRLLSSVSMIASSSLMAAFVP